MHKSILYARDRTGEIWYVVLETSKDHIYITCCPVNEVDPASSFPRRAILKATLYPERAACKIDDIIVYPEYRSRHMGKVMIKVLAKYLQIIGKRNGIKYSEVYGVLGPANEQTHEDMERRNGFLASLGFKFESKSRKVGVNLDDLDFKCMKAAILEEADALAWINEQMLLDEMKDLKKRIKMLEEHIISMHNKKTWLKRLVDIIQRYFK